MIRVPAFHELASILRTTATTESVFPRFGKATGQGDGNFAGGTGAVGIHRAIEKRVGAVLCVAIQSSTLTSGINTLGL